MTGSVAECEDSQFQCRHSGACIASHLVCDGHYQCGGDDTSDELACINSECISVSLSALVLPAYILQSPQHGLRHAWVWEL